MAKRQYGVGSIDKRDGRFRLRYRFDGKSFTKTLPKGTTRTEAGKQLRAIMKACDSGEHVSPNKVTLAQFFTTWLTTIKPNVSPRTHERYEQIANKNIAPLLGTVRLSRLTKEHIKAAYAQALESGRSDGKGGLSPRTVHHLHRVLFSALNAAVDSNLITRNPAAFIEKKHRPKVAAKAVSVVDAPTTAKIMDAARERRLFVPILLAALCGLRRGEITALRWKSVDLDNEQPSLQVVASTEQTDAGTVREKAPKSGRARSVALPAMALEELRKWRIAQAEELLRLGIRPDDNTHVVTKSDGDPLQPRSLTHVMSDFLSDWGMTLHKLRHSHASHLLALNQHPKVVQERLGHSSIAITLDIYSHLMPNMQGEAAAKLDVAFRGPLIRRSE